MKTKKYKNQKRKTKRRKNKRGGRNTPSSVTKIIKNPMYVTPTSKRKTQTRTKNKSMTKQDCNIMNNTKPDNWIWEDQPEVYRINVEKYKGQVNHNNVPHGYGYLANDDNVKLYQGFWNNGVATNCQSITWTPMSRKNINKRINEVLKRIMSKKGPAMREGAKKELSPLFTQLIV